jgi:hypothetical protein
MLGFYIFDRLTAKLFQVAKHLFEGFLCISFEVTVVNEDSKFFSLCLVETHQPVDQVV